MAWQQCVPLGEQLSYIAAHRLWLGAGSASCALCLRRKVLFCLPHKVNSQTQVVKQGPHVCVH